jgi:hypothetical protein
LCSSLPLALCRQTFQYFGLDFLVDAALQPWLMEVNATPSMKVGACTPHVMLVLQELLFWGQSPLKELFAAFFLFSFVQLVSVAA